MKNVCLSILLLIFTTYGSNGQPSLAAVDVQNIEISAIKPSSGKKYAIIIGVSVYEDKRISLKYASSDAKNFAAFIAAGYFGRFEDENVKFFCDEEATYGNIGGAINDWLMYLRPKIRPGDEVYFFYSGHGLLVREVQSLTCTNTRYISNNLNNLVANISFNILKDSIQPFTQQEVGVKVYLIIDACRRNDELTAISANKVVEEPTGPGEIMIYSASNDQFAYESSSLKSGVFTYFLILGLKGAADENKDNKVDIGEVQRFVERNVEDYVAKSLKKKTFQKPFFKIFRDQDRDNVLSILSEDTIKKYKEIYSKLKTDYDSEIVVKKSLALGTQKRVERYNPFTVEREPSSTKLDSNSKYVYEKLLAAISKKNLLEPEKVSAYYFYQELLKLKDIWVIREANSRLFAALLDHSQEVINSYLLGKLKIVDSKVFKIAYEELLIAKRFIAAESPMSTLLDPKLLFLKARYLAGSKDPKDWKKALIVIDSGIKQNSTLSYLHNTKGVLFQSSGQYFKALASFKQALVFAKDWTYAIDNVARDRKSVV